MTDSQAAIDVKGLNKSFGDKHVVQDVSIRVEEGRITGFLGPNGAGKTTTLRLLCGLLTPDSGEGEVLGLDFRSQTDAIKRQTGYMTQRFSLYEDMTIEENLSFIARVYELGDRRGRVGQALERLGLQDRRGQLAGALSGGWKQRLALAAATLHEPRLLLLDEPTAGVDPKARREFWDEIHTLADGGLTVLVSTHYMDEAERCHKLAYIAYGKLLAQGTSKEVIDSQGLVTWAVYGQNLFELGERLRRSAGIEQTVAFGSSLHVSGRDTPELHATLEQLAHSDPTLRLEPQETGLEDVFIFMMNRSTDNYAAPSAGQPS